MVISVEELKRHLRIEDNEEDDYLFDLLEQAQATAENFTRVDFGSDAQQPVRLAIMLMASFYYENRDQPDRVSYTTMRIAFENLLYPYRDPSLMF